MPTQTPDMLRPGEALLPGECLVSSDGRFRLYFEEDGDLTAYAYTIDQGIRRFWGTGVNAGPGSKVEMTTRRPRGSGGELCAVAIRSAVGYMAWSDLVTGYWSPMWQNLFFVMQSDGNVVHYVQAPPASEVRAAWASDTYRLWSRPIAIPPNTPVCEVPAPGTIILQPGVGDGDIVNVSSQQVSARDSERVVSIPPGESVSVALPGTILIEAATYAFTNLRAPSGTRPSRSSDAVVAVPGPTRPGERRRIEIGGGGRLTLRGLFRVPGTYSEHDLRITGWPGLAPAEGEAESESDGKG